MAKTRAKQETLGELHLITAEYFKQLLEDARESGEPIPAAMMGNILRFLHDNDIVAEGDTQNVLEEIREKMRKQKDAATLASKNSKSNGVIDLSIMSSNLPDDVAYEEILHDIDCMDA